MNEFLSMAIYIALLHFTFWYEYFAYHHYDAELSEWFIHKMDWLKWIILFFIFGNFIVICVRW